MGLSKYTALLRNRNFIFSLALSLAVTCGQGTQFSKNAVLPALAVVMTVSTLSIPGEFFRFKRSMVRPLLAGILMTFIIQAGVLLGIGSFLYNDLHIIMG